MGNWQTWIKGLISAAVSSASNAGLAIMIKPEVFNFGTGLNSLLMMAAGGAVIGVLNYLAKSPLPNGKL